MGYKTMLWFLKGHTYMTYEYKTNVSQYLKIGADDKVMKISAVLMLEALYGAPEHTQMHPQSKHHLPYVSEISIVISQLSTSYL